MQAGDSSYIHINPRFDQGCVVRNSDHGGWGQEERDGDLPFARGQHFEVIILVEPTRYRVDNCSEISVFYLFSNKNK